MSGLPESGHGWTIYEYTPSLTPLADLGRLARQAHCTAWAPPVLARLVTMPRSARGPGGSILDSR
jgi:hypothetical protein